MRLAKDLILLFFVLFSLTNLLQFLSKVPYPGARREMVNDVTSTFPPATFSRPFCYSAFFPRPLRFSKQCLSRMFGLSPTSYPLILTLTFSMFNYPRLVPGHGHAQLPEHELADLLAKAGVALSLSEVSCCSLPSIMANICHTCFLV